MPRKPNYSFERVQRERAKTAKQAAKKEARALAKNQPPGEPGDENAQDAADRDPAAEPGVRTAEGVENVAKVDPERRGAERAEGVENVAQVDPERRKAESVEGDARTSR